MEHHRIFVDGACRGNPGPGGWGVIVFFADGSVREGGGARSPTTNNQMELQAAIEGLKIIREHPQPAELCSDSRYVVMGASEWLPGWLRKGGRTAQGGPVANWEQWCELHTLMQGYPSSIQWTHIRGHVGIPGNERADAIATAFADGRPALLYKGPIQEYGFSAKKELC